MTKMARWRAFAVALVVAAMSCSSTEGEDTESLRGDGFATVTFGTPADAAIAAISERLGAPSDDTGWIDPLSISTCPGTQLRRVSWGGVLSMLFGDESPFTQGTPHFFAWSYGDVGGVGGEPAGLVTPEQIGLGATLTELRTAYPYVSVAPGDEGLFETGFYVEDNFGGVLTGETDADIVTVLTAGQYCG